MNKFTLIAFEASKNKLLKKLQAFGEVEFINLQSKRLEEENEALSFLQEDTLDSSAKDIEDILSKLRSAIEFLKNYVPKESALKALKEGIPTLTYEDLKEYGNEKHWINTISFLKSKAERLNAIDNAVSKLRSELDALYPWKNFDIPFTDLEGMKNVVYYIGTIPLQNENNLNSELDKNFPNSYLEVISRDTNSAYILVFAHKNESREIEAMIKTFEFSEVKLNYTKKPEAIINDINKQLNSLLKEKPSIEDELKAFADKLTDLERAYEYYENKLLRYRQSENFLKSNKTVVISGWVPEAKTEVLESYVKDVTGNHYFLDFSEVKEEEIDDVPIMLNNNKIVKSFESITAMYSLPKYTGIDPTPLLTPFYMIFFGMMVADLGYGLIVTLAALFVLNKFNLEEKTENFVRFFFYLGISTAVWGAVYGSFFGNLVQLPALINPNKDIFSVLYLSLGFGVLQIFVGLFIKAYVLIRDGKPLDALYDAGSWIITLVSIGLMAAFNLAAAKYTMILGMLLIVATNGRQAGSLGARLGGGLYALYGITGYIGDLVSYTRLMALGIAGGSIAGAMNLIMSYFPGVSIYIIGPLFFAAVQIFNLLLSLLGAYVHTCRLQYVEYFSKFYEGGGRPFTPFKMINKYIKIK
ncbi:V-type ATP synthase subunit I [Clostridium sp. SYSU_GA19001]|nr:V-type ATP synthase subunit I [Clostridium caldaquaticum]